MDEIKLDKISTEQRNKSTLNIDTVSTLEMVKMINDQDKLVANAVLLNAEAISKIIDKGSSTISNGGRIIYMGAGTSGRLGILDASEIFPTFGEADLFIGLIAGGKKAIQTPVENAEDNEEFAIEDLKSIKFNKKDLLIGIAASGRTPYVISGLNYANGLGAVTGSISTSKDTKISKIASISIEAVVGAETITGSTRMKSGTAQKLILNTISTGIMIKLNKVYSNLMVDIKPTNLKLIERSIKMIMSITNADKETSKKAFEDSGNNVKIASVMIMLSLTKEQAQEQLLKNKGNLRQTIKEK